MPDSQTSASIPQNAVPATLPASSSSASLTSLSTFERAARLAELRQIEQRLFDEPIKRRFLFYRDRHPSKFYDLRSRIMVASKYLEDKGSATDVHRLNQVVDCLCGDHRNYKEAGRQLNMLREAYEDGPLWQATNQAIDAHFLWAFVGIILTILAKILSSRYPTFLGIGIKGYIIAGWAGGVGSFMSMLTFRREGLIVQHEDPWFTLLRLGMRPLTAAFYGVITMIALHCGVTNLKVEAESQSQYYFLVCLAAGFGGAKTFDVFERLRQPRLHHN